MSTMNPLPDPATFDKFYYDGDGTTPPLLIGKHEAVTLQAGAWPTHLATVDPDGGPLVLRPLTSRVRTVRHVAAITATDGPAWNRPYDPEMFRLNDLNLIAAAFAALTGVAPNDVIAVVSMVGVVDVYQATASDEDLNTTVNPT